MTVMNNIINMQTSNIKLVEGNKDFRYSPSFKSVQADSYHSQANEIQRQERIKKALEEQEKAQKKNKRIRTITLATSGILTAAILASVGLSAYQMFGKKVPKSVFSKINDKMPALTDECINPKVKDLITQILKLRNMPESFIKEYDANICNNFAIFHGVTGTGKTFSAKLLAKELNANYAEVQFSELSSKYVGETSVFITQKFKELLELARKNPKENYVVAFNEIDSLLVNLANEAGNTAHLTQNRTAFLNGLDAIKGCPNLMIVGTTNVNPKLGGLDSASLSRIGNNIFEIELPTLKEIVGGLKHNLKGKKGGEKLLADENALTEIGTLIHKNNGAQRDVFEIFNASHNDFLIDVLDGKTKEFTKDYLLNTINKREVWAASKPKVNVQTTDNIEINAFMDALWKMIAKTQSIK